MSKTKCVIDEFHFENEYGEYIDVKINFEGYLELQFETSDRYTIQTQAEIDLIHQKLTEALKSTKLKKWKKPGKSS
jgi:hypothetical protein